jgi:sensor domain CHASE-containing protein
MNAEELALLEEIDEIRRLAGMPKLNESLQYPLTLMEIAEELDNIKNLLASNVPQAGNLIDVVMTAMVAIAQLRRALQEHSNRGYTIINTDELMD